ncbi:MAG: hypothetical protein AAFU79_06795 [Myxococcota bacterium]
MKASHLSLPSILFALAGCFPEASVDWAPQVEEEEPTPSVGASTGEPAETSLTETTGRSLLDEFAPADSGLVVDMVASTRGVGASEISGRADAPYLQDGFANAVALFAREQPTAVGSIEEGLGGPLLDAATSETGGVGAMIRHAADVLGDAAWDASAEPRQGLEAAAQAICARFKDSDACGPAVGDLPEALEQALAPVLWAIHDGVVARLERDAALEVRDADWWALHGGKGLLAAKDMEGYNADFPEDRTFLSETRGKLFGAAAAIADAVQAVDWSVFRGLDVTYDFQTPAGWIRVRCSESCEYEDNGEDILFLLDTGGDDLYLNQTASNTSGANAVSVVVDLGGNDRYGYEAAENANLDGPRLPLDADGVVTVDGRIEEGSASEAARQGAARNGIAMLFDLGAGEDQYVALRASQGYAHQGVGVLFDDGGRDTYLAEDVAQGAGQFGIGLLVDLGNDDDVRRSSRGSQGFGYVAGVGMLVDAGGDDQYDCHPDHGGDPAYFAPQMPGRANASFCQGAGLGFRIKDARYSLAGGVGILLDAGGDDRYRAGVYGQGVGYWQGFGFLSDRSGSDSYDAFYYGQGASAHFGVGYLADGGPGNDTFNAELAAETMLLGAANDFSVAVFINEQGDDTYSLPGRAASVASCGSVSLFVDNGGRDTYSSSSGSTAGVALSQACGQNTDVVSSAIFLDVGGMDDWSVASGQIGNDARWADGEINPGEWVYARDVPGGDSGIHVGVR